jgi:hypothetical protein
LRANCAKGTTSSVDSIRIVKERFGFSLASRSIVFPQRKISKFDPKLGTFGWCSGSLNHYSAHWNAAQSLVGTTKNSVWMHVLLPETQYSLLQDAVKVQTVASIGCQTDFSAILCQIKTA